jgi:hypothetical protein
MDLQPVLGFVIQPPQSRDPGWGGKIQLSRILDTQDERTALHSLRRAPGMNLQNFPPVQCVIIQQSIGCLRLRPASAGQRDTSRRLCRPIVYSPDQALGPPHLSPLQTLKFLPCPTHATLLPPDENLYLNNKLEIVGNRVHSTPVDYPHL